MKIRTKLVLLLSAALVVTLVASTLLRIRWTRTRLEDQLRESARSTAEVVAADLLRRLTPDKDGDDVAEELQKVKLRHPVVADLQLTLDTDEDTTATFSLAPEADEPKVARRPRATKRPLAARREDARRALLDHGESSRRPGARVVEPLWWTADKPPPSHWPPRAVGAGPSPPPQPKVARTFREGERGARPVFEVKIPIDPDGPRHGELVLSVSREPIYSLERIEMTYSLIITGGAVLILMLLTTLIIDRVVGKPVSELEGAMKRVSGGALDARVETRREDEIGHLTNGFNQMLARIAEADQEIRAFNRRLADEVQAATTDLERKNNALAQLNRLLFEARRELGDKERMAALGQLAAQLAHEIGTPLASVSGHLQLALHGPGGRDLPPALKERLQVATSELGRISKIVRDYLDSTRAVQPERVRVELARVVDEAIDLVSGLAGGLASGAGRARVSFKTDLSRVNVPLYTDPGLLRQILVNLLTNAADAVGPDGHVEVIAELEEAPDATGPRVKLAVKDDGVGIAPEDAARIFEPFYTTKGRGKGTGLGLAICRELATALGGRISVVSEPGVGSTFTVTLPHALPAPATVEKAS
jgi:signal transduction histidine kinase